MSFLCKFIKKSARLFKQFWYTTIYIWPFFLKQPYLDLKENCIFLRHILVLIWSFSQWRFLTFLVLAMAKFCNFHLSGPGSPGYKALLPILISKMICSIE